MSIASDEKLKNLEKRVIALEAEVNALKDKPRQEYEARFEDRQSIAETTRQVSASFDRPTTISIKDKSWKNAS